MIYVKKTEKSGKGLFTDKFIKKETLIFNYEEWIEDEKMGWLTIDAEDLDKFNSDEKFRFLRYSYDIDFGKITGTLDWNYARHPSNFMNHSCEPNMIYGKNNSIIAARDIQTYEELTIDYGTFIVNVDQNFICTCGSKHCRKIIRKDDWKNLITIYHEHFPEFIVHEIRKLTLPHCI